MILAWKPGEASFAQRRHPHDFYTAVKNEQSEKHAKKGARSPAIIAKKASLWLRQGKLRNLFSSAI